MQVELPEPVVDTKELAKSPKKASIDRNARLFNKNVLAAEAFKWDLKRMLHFLSDAAKNPDHYGVHRDHHHTLTTAVTKLEELSDLSASRAFLTPDEQRLDPMDIDWENVQLKCHSQYEVLGLVLSILGRAPLGATRSNHHLPLLILCVKFVILAAGDAPKKSAPNLVSIMFTEDDGDFKVQVAVSELESPVDGQGVSTANSDLNVVMGSTIFQGKTDLPANNIQELRRLIQNTRYDFLENESGYKLPGRDVGMKGACSCGSCGETFGSGLLRHNTTFKGRKVGGLALKINPVIDMEEIDDLKLDALLDPCDNCKNILRQAGVDVERFSITLVDEEAVA